MVKWLTEMDKQATTDAVSKGFREGMIETGKIYNESCMDTLRRMPDESIDMCVTSPPYFGLRDYGVNGQIGLEA
jgi:hypothetical protein